MLAHNPRDTTRILRLYRRRVGGTGSSGRVATRTHRSSFVLVIMGDGMDVVHMFIIVGCDTVELCASPLDDDDDRRPTGATSLSLLFVARISLMAITTHAYHPSIPRSLLFLSRISRWGRADAWIIIVNALCLRSHVASITGAAFGE